MCQLQQTHTERRKKMEMKHKFKDNANPEVIAKAVIELVNTSRLYGENRKTFEDQRQAENKFWETYYSYVEIK